MPFLRGEGEGVWESLLPFVPLEKEKPET